jgi:phage shock protein PspC (stress-responsive transcriptional regulator)
MSARGGDTIDTMTNEPAETPRRPSEPGPTGPADEFGHEATPTPNPAPATPTPSAAAADPEPVAAGMAESVAADPAVHLGKPGDPPLAPPAPPPGPLWPEAGTAYEPASESTTRPDVTAAAPDPVAAAATAAPRVDAGIGLGLNTGLGPETGLGTEIPTQPAPAAAFSPSAFATRHGLRRPLVGRHLAGVCAAIGRATNTDPVLWRVLFAVLTFFGGVGLLAYLLGWLLIPADGDTASPAEALLGRGQSRTSAPTVIVGAVAAALVFTGMATEGLRPVVVSALVVLAAVLLLTRKTRRRQAEQAAMVGATGPVPPGLGLADPMYQPGAAQIPAWTAPYAPQVPYPAVFAPGSAPPAAPASGGWPQVPQSGPPAGGQAPPVYRPAYAPHGPFAPHGPYPPQGPYAPHGPYARRGYGSYAETPAYPYSTPPISSGPVQYPGLPYSGPPVPPRPRKPKIRSRLGRATFSAALLAAGILAIVHSAGVHISPAAYPAIALAVVGAGLVVGAWVGRARLLIPLGFALTLALMIATAASHQSFEPAPRDNVWAPVSVAEINPDGYRGSGSALLDLTQIDFSGHDVPITVHMEFGDLRILLPPNVDVDVTARVQIGDMQVFRNRQSGIRDDTYHVVDEGPDGPGPGKLRLNVEVEMGSLEVSR